MNIGVDYRLAKTNPYSGMGVYVSQIVKNLTKIDAKNTYLLLGNKNLISQKSWGKLVALFKELAWVNFGILNLISEKKIGLLYFPNPPSPLFSSVPVILTIPDLSFYWDRTMNPLLKIYLFILYFFSAQRATEITTFSLNSKRDISKFLHVPQRKISIISPAVKTTFVKKRVKRQKYILSVPGSFVPRKNVLDLVEVFSSLPVKLKRKYNLVLVGNRKDGYFRMFHKSIKNKPDIGRVVFTGYVSEKELIELYSGASVLVSTSLYEGFSLTPLEAMACGVPVVAYKNSSLTEIVGNAGILISGKDKLRNAILRVLSDVSLRKKLIRMGRERAKVFSWERSSYDMLKLIGEVTQ